MHSSSSGGQLTLTLWRHIRHLRAAPAGTLSSRKVSEANSNTENSLLQVQGNMGDSSQAVGAVVGSSAFLPHVATRAVLGAEVRWTLKTCISHYLYNSCSDINPVLPTMLDAHFLCGSWVLVKNFTHAARLYSTQPAEFKNIYTVFHQLHWLISCLLIGRAELCYTMCCCLYADRNVLLCVMIVQRQSSLPLWLCVV